MFNFEYTQNIKIRTSVSLQTVTTSESTFEACNSSRVYASLWLQTLITLFPYGKTKYFFSLEAIIKEIGLGRIPELTSSTYSFIIFIK